MKFKDFQAPVLFSSTFKALNLGEKNSSTFKDAWESCTQLSPSVPAIGLLAFSLADESTISTISSRSHG